MGHFCAYPLWKQRRVWRWWELQDTKSQAHRWKCKQEVSGKLIVWHLAPRASRSKQAISTAFWQDRVTPGRQRWKAESLILMPATNDSLFSSCWWQKGPQLPSESRTEKHVTSLLYLQMPRKNGIFHCYIKMGYIMNVLWLSSFFSFCDFTISDCSLNRRPLPLNLSLPAFYPWFR